MARSPRHSRPNTNQASDWLVFFFAAALLALAPIMRGGNRQLALVALLTLGAGLLAVLLGSLSFDRLFDAAPQPSRNQNFDGLAPWQRVAMGLVISCPLWLGVLYLAPWSAELWHGLAGRGSLYFEALAAAGGKIPGSLPLSLNPQATITALLSGVPAAATLLAALFLPRPLVEKCLTVLLVAGLFQALLAVLQFWMGAGSPLYFGVRDAAGLLGSFANRNHLADFLVMLLPLWFFRLTENPGSRATRTGHRERGTRWGGTGAFWMAFGFALLVVIIATLSRGGLLSGAVVLAGCIVLLITKFTSRLTRKQQVGLAAVAAVFAISALMGVGAERIAQRLDHATVQKDAYTRNEFSAATLDGARTLWPWGSGPGTYESVFPRFQAADSMYYVEYAHNDYAQLLMELGLPGVLLGAAVLALMVAQWLALLRAYRAQKHLSGDIALRAFCGLSVVGLLLHSVVEFNMHIPALALTAAFLLGVFLRPLERPRATTP